MHVFAPFVQANIHALAAFVHTIRTEIGELLPEENRKALQELLTRNFRITGSSIKRSYSKAVTGLKGHYGADIDIDSLRATAAVADITDKVVSLDEARKRKSQEGRGGPSQEEGQEGESIEPRVEPEAEAEEETKSEGKRRTPKSSVGSNHR